jgi:type III secretion system FlhB-like substrate exporter
MALRLIELAQAHGMTLNKNADLSALLAALQITDTVPIPAFAVVAEVLFSVLSASALRSSSPGPTP